MMFRSMLGSTFPCQIMPANHPIEGMPNRLRRPVTPHVKRYDCFGAKWKSAMGT
jgi:hypothetical protein